jgi:hypothetical protein
MKMLLSLTVLRIRTFFRPGSNKKKKKGGHKFHKIEYYLIFWTGTEKIWVNWHRIWVFLPQHIVTKLSEIWVGSGIQDPEKLIPESDIRKKLIPDLGVKKAPDLGSATLVINILN